MTGRSVWRLSPKRSPCKAKRRTKIVLTDGKPSENAAAMLASLQARYPSWRLSKRRTGASAPPERAAAQATGDLLILQPSGICASGNGENGFGRRIHVSGKRLQFFEDIFGAECRRPPMAGSMRHLPMGGDLATGFLSTDLQRGAFAVRRAAFRETGLRRDVSHGGDRG